MLFGVHATNHFFIKVQKLQNRAARISTSVGRYESVTAALSTMKWHNLSERHEYHLASTLYKIMNNHVPPYLTNRFSVRDSGYNLRATKTFSFQNLEQSSRKDHYRIKVQYTGMLFLI